MLPNKSVGRFGRVEADRAEAGGVRRGKVGPGTTKASTLVAVAGQGSAELREGGRGAGPSRRPGAPRGGLLACRGEDVSERRSTECFHDRMARNSPGLYRL